MGRFAREKPICDLQSKESSSAINLQQRIDQHQASAKLHLKDAQHAWSIWCAVIAAFGQRERERETEREREGERERASE